MSWWPFQCCGEQLARGRAGTGAGPTRRTPCCPAACRGRCWSAGRARAPPGAAVPAGGWSSRPSGRPRPTGRRAGPAGRPRRSAAARRRPRPCPGRGRRSRPAPRASRRRGSGPWGRGRPAGRPARRSGTRPRRPRAGPPRSGRKRSRSGMLCTSRSASSLLANLGARRGCRLSGSLGGSARIKSKGPGQPAGPIVRARTTASS